MQKRAVVYTRVSTDREEQKTSLKFQREHYTEFCEQKGYNLVKLYADEGLTGTNSKREKFLEMLNSAGLDYSFRKGENTVDFYKSKRDPLFDLIIVKDVTRFSRNMDTLRPIRLLKEMGVHILFENNNLNTESDDYQERLNIYLMMAENESRDKSKKMRWTLKHKASKDSFHFSVLPFGYDYDKENGEYIINEEEAKVVEMIYDMYVNQNKGIRLIADYLNANNIPGKNGKSKWVDTTIGRMIASERYIGNVIVQKYTKHDVTGTGQRIIKDEDEWKRIPNALEPIVDEELWNKAQQIRKNRTQKISDNSLKGVRLADDDVYHQKIKCGRCGSPFTRISKVKTIDGEKVREYSYMCYKRRKTRECDIRGVSFNVLDREFNKIRKRIIPENLSYDINNEGITVRALIRKLDEKLSSQTEQIAKIQSELDLISEQLSNATMLLLNNPGENVKKAINNQVETLQIKKDELELKKLDFDTIEIEKEKEAIITEFNRIKSFYKKMNEKEIPSYEELLELLHRIVVKDDRHLMVVFKIPSLTPYYIWASDRKKLDKEYDRFLTFEVKY